MLSATFYLVKDNLSAIGRCEPVMPSMAHNRPGDNWRPLFAVAQTIGGHWPQLAQEAFEALGRGAGQPTSSTSELGAGGSMASDLQLLADVRLVFARSGAQRLFSSVLVERLRALPDRAWGGRNGETPMSGVRLARYLSRFGVAPRQVRIGGRQARGYELADLVGGA